MGQMNTVSKGNTRVFTNDSTLAVVLYNTKVVEVEGYIVTLNSGGWRTVTTKARMNQASNQYRLGYTVFQKDGDWFVRLKYLCNNKRTKTIEFFDNMRFNMFTGTLV
jgi:hypothetical protein